MSENFGIFMNMIENITTGEHTLNNVSSPFYNDTGFNENVAINEVNNRLQRNSPPPAYITPPSYQQFTDQRTFRTTDSFWNFMTLGWMWANVNFYEYDHQR
jgi:hypothetical protein